MKASTRRFLLMLGYLGTLAWIVPALTFSIYQAVEQHEIFAMLRTIRYGQEETAVVKAEKGLGEFGLEGLIYVIQELKQDEERDRRVKLANALERFLTADSNRKRWGWGERGALYKLLEAWPQTPGKKMADLDMAQVKDILLTKKPAEIKPAERNQVLNFAIEYALVTMSWNVDDRLDLFRNKAERLRFKAFLDLVNYERIKMKFRVTEVKPEVELSGDQMKRAQDFFQDWLNKEEASKDKLLGSEAVSLAHKLEGFLGGDPVKFASEECDKMVKTLEEQRDKEDMLCPRLQPAVYASLREKLQRFADGGAVDFTAEDAETVCDKLEKFKDDYISYAVGMKFKKTTESHFVKLRDEGVKLIDLREDEIPVLLKIDRQCRREYAYARVQMARSARRIVRDLTGRHVRFQCLVKDMDPNLGVFKHIGESWRAKNDEIVMLDLIDLLQDDDFGVRVNMSDALVAMGEPAIYYLVRQLKKERVSSTAVVPTRDKGRDEREKELNAKNTRARKEVAMILGRIGSKKAGQELERMTKDAVIGATVHDALERLHRQKVRK